MSDVIDDFLSKNGEEEEAARSQSSGDLNRISDIARELLSTEEEVAVKEAELKILKTRRHELRTKTLPDAMMDVGVDMVGIPGTDTEIRLEVHTHANIPANWSPERRDEAFDYLETLPGGEDVVRREVVVSAGAGETEKVRMLREWLEQKIVQLELSAVLSVERRVPWQTLSKFIRETLNDGEIPVDVKRLNGTHEQIAKIVRRD